MQRHRNLVYATAGDRALKLDLYLPEEALNPVPLIIWVHGGAWRMGSKENPRALWMVEEGYAVASVGYRLSQEAIFPAQIHDCKAAVRWLRAHAYDYNIDPGRFGAWGSSAGGHLVALLGTSAGVPEMDGDLGEAGVSSAVQAVCDWFGPSDLTRMNEVLGSQDHDAPDSPESQLVGAPIQTRPDLAAQANPITYIKPDAPPFLIMHGTADDTVIPLQSTLLFEALTEAGGSAGLLMLSGLGHGFQGEHGRWPEIDNYVRAFFGTYLQP